MGTSVRDDVRVSVYRPAPAASWVHDLAGLGDQLRVTRTSGGALEVAWRGERMSFPPQAVEVLAEMVAEAAAWSEGTDDLTHGLEPSGAKLVIDPCPWCETKVDSVETRDGWPVAVVSPCGHHVQVKVDANRLRLTTGLQ